MNKRIFVIFIPAVLLALIYIYLYKETEILPQENQITVYTYSSFASSWGPAPELKRIFKAQTGIEIEFVDAGEAGIIYQRILLDKGQGKADVVLGIDQFQLDREGLADLFFPIENLSIPFDKSAPAEKIIQGPFVAYNWAPMTLIYRKSDKNKLPKKLDDFLSPNFKGKIILLDPRTSSPGYIFFHWIVQKYGELGAKNFIESIKKNIYTVTPSWSAGYGLFKKKQADYVFSYLTSPAYHWIEENDSDYQPVYLEEKIPYHIEYAALLKSSGNRIGANKFLEFILSQEAQEIIMKKNYMLPVRADVPRNKEFKQLKNVELFESEKNLSREQVLNVWKSVTW